MADYEKECFMVQGFSSSSTTSNPHSEFVQDGQQGINSQNNTTYVVLKF